MKDNNFQPDITKTIDIIKRIEKHFEHFNYSKDKAMAFLEYLKKELIFTKDSNRLVNSLNEKYLILLEKYLPELACYWSCFDVGLWSDFIVKDLSFFLLLLFNVPQSEIRSVGYIWSKFPNPLSLSSINIKYSVPSTYMPFLFPKTKKKRLEIAKGVLSLFEASLELVNRDEESISPQLVINKDFFLKEIITTASTVNRFLDDKDFIMMKTMIDEQTIQRSTLIELLKWNKNTISHHYFRLLSKKAVFNRFFIDRTSFRLKIFTIFWQSQGNLEFRPSFARPSNPWFFMEKNNGKDKKIFYFLIPDDPMALDDFINVWLKLKEEYLPDKMLITYRKDHHFFLSYEPQLFNPKENRWKISFDKIDNSNDDTNHTMKKLVFPFLPKPTDYTFKPTKKDMRIINTWIINPYQSVRSYCGQLNMSSTTLKKYQQRLINNRIVKKHIGLFPFELPINISLLVENKSEKTINNSIINDLATKVPIIHGSCVTGDINGFIIDIPMPHVESSLSLKKYIETNSNTNSNLLWFQINESPYLSNWFFPLGKWDDELSKWKWNYLI